MPDMARAQRLDWSGQLRRSINLRRSIDGWLFISIMGNILADEIGQGISDT